MNKLNKLYEAMLKSWGCAFTEDYQVILKMDGVDVPVLVDGKKTYLPTADNLNGITIGKVFFHPACESIMSKETEIFKVIRKLTSAKIYSVFQPIFEVIVNVASTKTGKTLNGKMLEALEPFKGLNKTVKQDVISIIKTISITVEDQGIDTRIINFSLIKGGKTDNDETAYYTATPSFPFYTEAYRTLAQNEHMKPSDRITFNNLNVSIQSLKVVIALFELAIPACIDPSRKKYSSTSPDAARLVAYLYSYGLVASDMQSLIGKFRKEFDAIGVYGVDLDWLNQLDEISEIKSLVPALDYNNYNLTSSPETPAANGQRISSFNPMAMFGISVPEHQQQNNSQNPQAPNNAPKQPDTLPGETYRGSEYFPSNGIYEFRFQHQNGLMRIRRLAEDGRFLSEDFQPINQMGMNNGMMNGNGMMNQNMMNNMMMMNMMNSGIPMVGLGGINNGVVRDFYSGQPIAGNNQNNNNQGGIGLQGLSTQNNTGVWDNTSVGINNQY